MRCGVFIRREPSGVRFQVMDCDFSELYPILSESEGSPVGYARGIRPSPVKVWLFALAQSGDRIGLFVQAPQPDT